MKAPIFWKAVSVAVVVGLFYLGHSLHERLTPAWDIITPACAGEQPVIGKADLWEQLWDGKEATWVVAAPEGAGRLARRGAR